MSEPTSKYTLSDILTRIAVEMGLAYYGSSGDEKAMLPIDAHNLDLCKRVVEDGIKKFIADAPLHGWRWVRRILAVTFASTRVTGTADAGTNATHLIDATLITTYDTADDLKDWYAYILTGTGKDSYAKITAYDESTGDCTVGDWLDANGNAGGTDPVATDTFALTNIETIGGDKARYPLPENFGGEANGPIRYAKDTSHGGRIEWSHEAVIRGRRAVSVTSGYPALAAIRPFEPVNSAPSAKRRFELIVDPEPSAADIVEFPYTLFFDKLQLEAGDASAGAADSLTDDTLADLYPDDYFNDWIIRIISGTGKNSYAAVEDYTGSSGKFDIMGDDWLSIDGSAGGTDPSSDSVYYVEPANNLHPAGFRFDWVILAACLSEAEAQAEEQTSMRWTQEYMQKALPKAHETDRRSAPKKLGNLNQRIVRERVWNDVTYE